MIEKGNKFKVMVNKAQQNMNIENVKVVIESLGYEFDTHEFIEKFIIMCERDYVAMLYSDIDKDGIFKAAHSKIGKFLANMSSLLDIEKTDKDYSENIKKRDTENQNWRKKV